ncbi:calcium-binding protein [Mesorhizobium sp. CCNWLW179-1]|uniref:calcium-binding protein n=1 Tax=Mesorhizobium sp. CCNWLW179-1 TaxID=3136721 RepID=UPI0032161A54
MVAEATINQFRAGNPLDIIEHTAELPGQTVQSFSSTKIVWGKKSGSFWAQDRIEIEGQNLSYNPLTGVASGTVTSIKIIPAIRLIINGVAQPDPLEIIGLSQPVGPIVQAVMDGNYAALTAMLDAQPFVYNGSSGNDNVTFGAAYDKLHMGAGNDVAHGGGGNDLLEGWSGHDVLYGDGGDDLFYGNTGNDKLFGGTGNDTIYAAEDNDYLDGGAGNDTMYGGTGNDIFVVSSTGDRVIESASQGTDTVRSHIDWTLGANVERLELQGTTNLVGNGNSLGNTVIGNSGNNVLRGGAGNDLLSGGAGKDTLVGGSGNDAFHFDARLGSTNIDKITDYNVAQDMIQLENSVFTGLANGWLSAGAFHTGSAAHDSTDRIIYNKTTGDLYFDKDGLGGAAATKFATLSPGLAMTAGDFFVV